MSGVKTYVAVNEPMGRLYILKDACGSPAWYTVGATGLPGDDPFAYCIAVGGGMPGGSFFVTAGYWGNNDIDLYEAYHDAALDEWRWINLGHPAWASDLVGTPVAVRDGYLLVLRIHQNSGRLLLTGIFWVFMSGWQWSAVGVGLHNDDIEPGSLTGEFGVLRCVVKGTSGRFWMYRADGSYMRWFDLGAP